MTQEVILAHLYVIRAQVDALIMSLQPQVVQKAICPVTGGPHPEDKVVDASQFGQRRKKCLACDEEWDA